MSVYKTYPFWFTDTVFCRHKIKWGGMFKGMKNGNELYMTCQKELHHSYYFDLSSYAHNTLFDGIVYPWELLPQISIYLNSRPLGKILGKVSPQAYLVKPELISIGVDTVVEPGAYIEGPCVIGNHCRVRHGAYIRGNLITGDRCVIGHQTEVKNSIFLDDVHAAHSNYVGDSLLGNRVNLGAGVRLGNLKLDHTLINIYIDGNRLPTGMNKLGAIIGDGAQIGCNTVTNPGTLMGKNVLCYPCINVKGFIVSSSVVKPSISIEITPRCQ